MALVLYGFQLIFLHKLSPVHFRNCPTEPQCHLQDGAVSTGKEKAAILKEKVTRSGARVLVHTPQKIPLSPGKSPATRDPGPQSREPQLSREIRRLQKELSTYIQRIEQLFDRGTLRGWACLCSVFISVLQ